jgi:hypothetical protein
MMSKSGEVAVAGLVGCSTLVLITALYIPLLVWQGYAATKLWAWFAVPLLGLPALGLWAMVGLALVVGIVWPTYPSDYAKREFDSKWEKAFPLMVAMLRPAFALLIGWIVRGLAF